MVWRSRILAWLGVALCWSSPATASIVFVNLPYGQFGHLENTTIDGNGACAATSIINSFEYLQNAFPEIYDQKLIPNGDLAAARDELHGKIWNDGGDQKYVWEQKIKWFDDHNLGDTTVFHGMTSVTTSGWYQSQWITGNQFPTWDFLWNEISHKEDVEFGLYDHMMTLTSLKFDDLGDEPNGKWDPETETAWVDYIDPNFPETTGWSRVELSSGGALRLMDVSYTNPYIYYAFAESPIPEPATIIVWSVLAGLGIAVGWRR